MHPLGLKTKITIAVSALVILLMVVVAYVTFTYFEKQLKTSISNDQFLMLSALANEIDQKLFVAHRQLMISSKEVPQGAFLDPDTAQQWLDSRNGLHDFFDNHIFLLSPRGGLIAESPFLPERRGLDLSFRSYFNKTVATRQSVISDPYITTQASGHPVIMMTTPVFDKNGKLAGLLSGSLDLMGSNLLGDISRMKIGQAGYLYLTTADRTVIMHPDKERIFKFFDTGRNLLYDRAVEGFEGTGETMTTYGVPMLTSFKRLRVNNWILAANYPLSEAHEVIRDSQRHSLMAAGGGVICIFMIVFFLIKRLTDPLVVFTRHVKALSEKSEANKLLRIASRDEIGTLSEAFNHMIVELDRQKEALRQSEEKFRIFFTGQQNGVFVIDPRTHTIVDINPAALRLIGAERDEIIGKVCHDVICHPASWRCPITDLHQETETSEGQVISRTMGFVPVIKSVRKITIAGQEYLIESLLDISERKRAEEEKMTLELQLSQAQKMEAVGQLAGGIAHDFNNILTAIIGYGKLLQIKLEKNNPLQRYIDHILTVSERASGLTGSLLAFSRKQVMESSPQDLNAVIQGIGKILSQLLTEDIELRMMLADEDLTIMADVTQLDQVLLNLATNARDAMPKGGKLTIATRRIEFDDAFIRSHGYGEPGRYAMISVTDTGIGMDEKTRKRIFEPFFTTKAIGKGTGLGLSIIYGIVKQHNGFINVYSEPGGGTTFHIYLPAIHAAIEKEIPVMRLIPGGTETILVAEDNLELRALIQEVLESKGYRIIAATNGEDAVKQYEDFQGKIDLLVLDVVMPRMNGLETCNEIRKREQNIKVLFMSGYTGDVVFDKGIEETAFNFISKPLSPNDLLLKVREILDRRKGGAAQ